MIKRYFSYVGVFVLFLFSFFYTDKAVEIVKKNDPIMKQLLKVKGEYNNSSEDAVLIFNNIIPGKSGVSIDVDRSYEKMKRYGSYDSSLLVFEEVMPDVSIYDYYDKYVISGNASSNMVSIIVKMDDVLYLDDYLKVVMNKGVSITFLFSEDLIVGDVIERVKMAGCDVELLDSSYDNKVIKRINKKLSNYNSKLSICYLQEDNDLILGNCAKNKMHTVKPSIIVNSHLYNTVKEDITFGSIIKLDGTSNNLNEFNSVINYIIQKGYGITTVSNIIKE